MDVTESKYRQQLVQAESFCKEKEAEVLDYQSQANALEQIANTRAEQLFAETKAVTKNGQNDVKELKVNLWAVQQRGDAQYSKLMTEAQSISLILKKLLHYRLMRRLILPADILTQDWLKLKVQSNQRKE